MRKKTDYRRGIFRGLVALMIVLAITACRRAASSGVDGNAGLRGMSLGADFRAFSSDSPWNTLIGDAETDVNSDLMIRNLQAAAGILVGSTRKWTVPVFIIDSEECPRVDVLSKYPVLYPSVDPDGNGVAENMPLPEGVWADPEEDKHMVLVDPVVRKSWEFSGVRRLADGQWRAGIVDVWPLDGPGFREPFSGRYWYRSGASGSGMPLIAGLIRPEEVEAGEIRHALLCATPINRKSSVMGGPLELCTPASRTDGYGVGVEFIPEGARLQLDPALDVDSLNLCAGSRVVARAMQAYGMYVAMNARTFKVFFQNLGPDAKVWRQYGFFRDLRKIPINRFRVLKCDVVRRYDKDAWKDE